MCGDGGSSRKRIFVHCAPAPMQRHLSTGTMKIVDHVHKSPLSMVEIDIGSPSSDHDTMPLKVGKGLIGLEASTDTIHHAQHHG